MTVGLTICSLGDLWAGSNGFECDQCKSRTHSVFLSDEEVQNLIPLTHTERMMAICRDKTGQALCQSHQPKEIKLAPWYYGEPVEESSTG